MRVVGSMHLEKEKDKDIEVKWNEVTNLHRSSVCTCPTTVWRTCDTHFSIYLAWLMKPSSDYSIFLWSNNRLSSDIYNSPWIQLLECKDGRSSPLKLYVLCISVSILSWVHRFGVCLIDVWRACDIVFPYTWLECYKNLEIYLGKNDMTCYINGFKSPKCCMRPKVMLADFW